jgi:hypothetical protein
MALRRHVTLPELQPWLNTRLQDYEELRLRKKAGITLVFVSSMVDVSNAEVPPRRIPKKCRSSSWLLYEVYDSADNLCE